MVHVLKNIAIRLWIAAAAGGLATMGLLAILGSPLDLTLNLVVAAVLTILVFLTSGWAFNRIASLRIQDYVREATSRERTAKIGEAGEAFRKAVTVFDSFMVSPMLRQRSGAELAKRVAQFHIARAYWNPEAESFVASYLWEHPDDGEVAEYWLQHTRLGDGADSDHLALADRIAAAQHENLAIHSLIAETYLARRRTDYTALQVYRRLLQESQHIDDLTILRLADLFVQEGRADEWALEVYLKAHTQDTERSEYLRGLAACINQVRKTDRNDPLFTAAKEILRGIDEDTIRQWQASFESTTVSPAGEEAPLAARIASFILRIMRHGARGIFHGIGTAAATSAGWIGSLGNSWKESPRTRHIARWGAVVVFAIIVIISGISTVIYIRETKEPPQTPAPPSSPAPQTATTGRYTVQAASFRNRPQAIDFAERIMNLGYPARWGESRSSDDKVWYYVRISRFETKQEAKKYAEDLKSKGIIDDFYIANYN